MSPRQIKKIDIKKKLAVKRILQNKKNKHDNEQREKNLSRMNYTAAVPRAPASSTARVKRLLNKKQSKELKVNNYASPKERLK